MKIFLLLILIFCFNLVCVSQQNADYFTQEILNGKNSDPYIIYQTLTKINQGVNENNRNLNQIVLDSSIHFSVPNDFLQKTEYIRGKSIERYDFYIKPFGTKEWIYDGCSEFGLNDAGQINYVYFAGCEGVNPFITTRFYYDTNDNLNRYEIWQAATTSTSEINRVVNVEYTTEGLLSKLSDFNKINENLVLSNRREFNHTDNNLNYILTYDFEEVMNDTIGVKSDSLHFTYSNEGLLIRKSDYALNISSESDLERREYTYDSNGKLEFVDHYKRFSSDQEWTDIRINSFFYDTDNSLREHFERPIIEDGVELSGSQQFLKTQLTRYEHDTNFLFDNAIFRLSRLSGLPYISTEQYNRINNEFHNSAIKEIKLFVEEGAIRTSEVEYFYSPITVSTSEIENERLKLVPNPTNGMTSITLQSGSIKQVRIYNLEGQLILMDTDRNLDLSEIKSGIYFVEILTDKQNSITKKLIKH
jgi:hypothetical protein